MQIISHGAARIVTGSCHQISSGGKNIIIDCGMYQGSKDIVRLNYRDFGFDPADIDAVIITHGHIDHCGLLPKLVKNGFSGPVYASDATADLIPVMLADSAYIQERETEDENRRRMRKGQEPREALYTREDAEKVNPLIRPFSYEQPFTIEDEFECMLQDAGHVIGSSIVEIKTKSSGKKLVFSGDLGQSNVPIIKDPTFIDHADYVFIESTYGDTVREKKIPRDDELFEHIKKTISSGGKLLIPSFALERTQELIYSISRLKHERKDFPDVPIYLDSPLAIKITEVFKKHPEIYDEEAKNRADNPFDFPGFVMTPEVEQSKSITKSKSPCIVIAGSGMCTAGRIRHHIRHGIEDKRNRLLFVGYQAHGTLGRILLEGKKTIKMMGREFIVRAKIARISSFSAHADRRELVQWLENFETKPEKVFLVHGEEDTIAKFSKTLTGKGFSTAVPKMGEELL